MDLGLVQLHTFSDTQVYMTYASSGWYLLMKLLKERPTSGFFSSLYLASTGIIVFPRSMTKFLAGCGHGILLIVQD